MDRATGMGTGSPRRNSYMNYKTVPVGKFALPLSYRARQARLIVVSIFVVKRVC